MKKIGLAILFTAIAILTTNSEIARADVSVSVSLPMVVFAAPPDVVVIPNSYVYFVPDIDEDIYFYNGWWWRPWHGRWYRSRHYDSGWGTYWWVPSFYHSVPSNWRNEYREHRWNGHPWDVQRINHQQVQGNWKSWKKSKHWEKHNNWGVQSHSLPLNKPHYQSNPSHENQQFQPSQSHERFQSQPNPSHEKQQSQPSQLREKQQFQPNPSHENQSSHSQKSGQDDSKGNKGKH
jgi:hypothetical protein